MAMKYLIILACLSITLAVTVEAWASRYWLMNGGGNGTHDSRSVGHEVGGTQARGNLLPLSAELSLQSAFDSIPWDTNFTAKRLNAPSTAKKSNNGLPVSYLFKSGVNFSDNVPNLTLQLGGGNDFQNVMSFAKSMASGTHWERGSKDPDSRQVGYVGLLYRFNSIQITAGYNAAGDNSAGYKNQRGVVLGIGKSW